MSGRIPLSPTRAEALARLLELTARQLHARSHAQGLYPAQWAALRYFQRAAGVHATTAGLARYHGLALGAVARTVRTLVAHGYLAKAGSAGVGRAERVELTEAGHALLRLDPLNPVATALAGLPEATQEALAEALEKIVTTLNP